MQLKVVGGSPVVVAHLMRWPGDVFEVSDAVGRQALQDHRVDLAAPDALDTEPIPSSDSAQEASNTGEPAVAVADLAQFLSKRTAEALAAGGISDFAALRDLVAQGDEAVLAISGIGKKALADIKAALEGVQ